MFDKTINQIQETDLDELVMARATEDERLEFKSEMYGQSDAEVKEMIRDIVAMANQKGGVILIGIEEDGDGVATAIPGIEGAGHVERITSSARANIAPRIGGMDIASIPLANGRSVIAVGLPSSLAAPHMVTYRGENRFWRRHVRQKDLMAVQEIEAAFMNKFDSVNRVEEFLENRQQECGTLPLGRQWLMMQATPIFRLEEVVDINDSDVRELLRRPPEHAQAGRACGAGNPEPSLRGLRAERRTGGKTYQYMELWREGYLEFGTAYAASAVAEQREHVPSTVLFGLSYSFVHLYANILQHLGMPTTPVILSLIMFNVRGCYLAIPSRLAASVEMKERVWDTDIINLPTVFVQDIATEADSSIRRWNDRLWNAFRYDRCLALQDDGTVITS